MFSLTKIQVMNTKLFEYYTFKRECNWLCDGELL